MKLEFKSDKLKVSGPNADDGYSITFYTGEYEQLNVAKLMALPVRTELTVSVIIKEEERI